MNKSTRRRCCLCGKIRPPVTEQDGFYYCLECNTINGRRLALITKKYKTALTNEETAELSRLQKHKFPLIEKQQRENMEWLKRRLANGQRRMRRVAMKLGSIAVVFLVLACIPKNATGPADQREVGIDVASPKAVVSDVQGPVDANTAALLLQIETLKAEVTGMKVNVDKSKYWSEKAGRDVNKGVTGMELVAGFGCYFIVSKVSDWLLICTHQRRRRKGLFP